MFGYVLDATRVNAQSIYCLNRNLDARKGVISWDHNWELAMSLVLPAIQRRLNENIQHPHAPRSIIRKMEIFATVQRGAGAAGDHAQPNFAFLPFRGQANPHQKKRCRTCINNAQSKEEKDKIAKTPRICDHCGQAICPTHVVCLCMPCISLMELKQDLPDADPMY